MYIMDIDKIHGFRETGYYFQKTNGRPLSNLLHSHTFYEFLYIASGSCTHYADGTQQKLHAGNLIVLTPHSQHRFLSQSENADVIALSVVCEEVDNFFSLYGINDFSASSFVLELSIEQQQTLLSMYENVIYSEVEEYITRLRMVLNRCFCFA